ncbi:MAG: hypothetical protein K8I03_12165 [Ignavibacteria bacterium]|nr:hypothetical protein [Ignavibacteria bacterium]
MIFIFKSMAGGPSKQELEMYWQNSRQYFDELAKHYQQADPGYYKEFIQPFYNNPFRTTVSSTGSKGNPAAKIILVAVLLMLIVAGAGVFFFFVKSDSIMPEFEKKTEDVKSTERPTKEIEKVEPTDPEEIDDMSSEDHFIIGSKKIGEKDYDRAEYHLKKVKPGDKYYEQSKQLLESMKFLRKYSK